MANNENSALIISQNIKALLAYNSLSRNELAKKLDVSTATVGYWCTGKKIPRMDKIDKMCTIFGVTRSQILIDSYTPNSTPAATPALTPDKEELLANYDKLNDEGKQDARKYVKLLGNSPEYTEDAEDTGNGNITA